MSIDRFRYRGPLRQIWLSICSKHRFYDATCNTCQAGQWTNILSMNVGHWVHDHCYPLWFWWANRRWFNSHRTFLKKHFPNLR